MSKLTASTSVSELLAALTDAEMRSAIGFDGNITVSGNKTWTGVQRSTGQNATPATEEEMIVWSVLKRHVPRVIFSSAVKVAHSPAVANEVLASFTVPGGTLGPNGWLEMRFSFTLKNTADVGTRITRFRLGGQTFKQLGSIAAQNLIVGGMVVLMNRGDEGTTKQLTNHQVTDARYYWDSTNNSDAFGDDSALTVNAAINTAIDQTFEVTHTNIAAGEVGILQALTVIAHYRP
jgi:hypothetical protein